MATKIDDTTTIRVSKKQKEWFDKLAKKRKGMKKVALMDEAIQAYKDSMSKKDIKKIIDIVMDTPETYVDDSYDHNGNHTQNEFWYTPDDIKEMIVKEIIKTFNLEDYDY